MSHTNRTLEEWKAIKKQYMASRRYDAEFGGFTEPNSGMFVRTDERTRILLLGGESKAKNDPNYTVPHWKTAEGIFITLNASTLLTLADAMHTFINAQFAKEEALCTAIDTATTIEEVRAIRWE